MQADADSKASELTELESVIPCSFHEDVDLTGSLEQIYNQCPNPAEWIWTLSCCGENMFRCDEHTQILLGWFNRMYADEKEESFISHRECGKLVRISDIRVERL